MVGIALLGLITAAVATWFVKHSAEQAGPGAPDGGDPTITTLALIAERLDRIEQRRPAPCPHCGSTTG